MFSQTRENAPRFFFCYGFAMKQALQKKIRVAILFGGRSTEHEVSIQSARNIVRALDASRYEVVLIGVDKCGTWIPFDETQLFLANEVSFPKKESDSDIVSTQYGFDREKLLKTIDVVFPALHGSFGEDGTLQGFLTLADIPFVGAGVLGSAIGMDKDVSKRLLRDSGIPVARFLVCKRHEKENFSFEKLKHELGVPFFIKPANLGSSVGVAKVHNEKEFRIALDVAFSYDEKILAEEYIRGREIECAVLGNETPRVSVCGEIVSHHSFYSYEAKYLDTNGATLIIPAEISESLSQKIQMLAQKVFEVLCCEGMARVDFFVTDDERVFVNEINTIPGFTSVSMYPKLWEASGVSYEKLIDTLIELARERFHEKEALRTSV